MPPPEYLLAGVLLLMLIIYVLTGGADFGAGVWDLLASGPRAQAQREAVAKALGPVWEANHVWLIGAVVVLFSAFPPAFAAIATALNIPLTLVLLGIILRGTAFAFRSPVSPSRREYRLWSLVFAAASAATPVVLGVCAGTLASGSIRADFKSGIPVDFFSSWFSAFPFSVGFLALALFAFLAATYLTLEVEAGPLREDFRARAFASGIAVCAAMVVSLLVSYRHAPFVWQGLMGSQMPALFTALTGVTALGALLAVWMRRALLAAALAASLAALIVSGWGLCQFPYILPYDLTLSAAASPASMLRPLLAALAAGMAVVVPAFGYLYYVFKWRESR